jgi:diaminopimelate epimerase
MQTIPFYKMSGSGNDFIIIDNRRKIVAEPLLLDLVKGACRRKLSVGADGFILVEDSDTVDFKWRFFNSDGSVAEMCGNGARCVARYAFLNKIAGSDMAFETRAGIVEAHVDDALVKIKMTDPTDLQTDVTVNLQSGPLSLARVNTGVPHVVITVKDIEAVAVESVGREIRYHARFAPAGTNVNFISLQKDGMIAIRTYERGVEGETLACGTGSVAAAIIANHTSGKQSPVNLMTRGGGLLTIYFEARNGRYARVYLQGDARVIYAGELWEEAWK